MGIEDLDDVWMLMNIVSLPSSTSIENGKYFRQMLDHKIDNGHVLEDGVGNDRNEARG